MTPAEFVEALRRLPCLPVDVADLLARVPAPEPPAPDPNRLTPDYLHPRR